MIAWLASHLGVELAPRRFNFTGGSRIEIDGASLDPLVLCAAWAHQGPPKSAQKFKVMNDGMKLLAAANLFPGKAAQLILLFADEAAAAPFRRNSWRAEALSSINVKVLVAELPETTRDAIRAAQIEQYR
jgi:hypothetical protein